MDHWSRDRVHVLVIALLLALGVGAWPIHAATMAPVITPDARSCRAIIVPAATPTTPVLNSACVRCSAGQPLGHRRCGLAAVDCKDGLRRDALLLCGQISGVDPGPPKLLSSPDA